MLDSDCFNDFGNSGCLLKKDENGKIELKQYSFEKNKQNNEISNCTRGTETWFVCQMKKDKISCINDLTGTNDFDIFRYKNITFQCESCLMAPDDKTRIKVSY